jgi:glycosyltransferase involved in cell wall biosynthesis
MVATPSMRRTLEAHGFKNLKLWTRGVDTKLFRPDAADGSIGLDLPKPIFLSVGRVAIEKNLEAFLKMDLPGSKVIVGDGPARASLQARYPDAFFLGVKRDEELARIYAAADVFVFPSLTDTFGLVMLEALASGVPVAAYPVPGPRDLITSEVGVLSHDLRTACLAAAAIPRQRCRDFAISRGWRASALQFLDNLAILQAEAA